VKPLFLCSFTPHHSCAAIASSSLHHSLAPARSIAIGTHNHHCLVYAIQAPSIVKSDEEALHQEASRWLDRLQDHSGGSEQGEEERCNIPSFQIQKSACIHNHSCISEITF
jgi:hypothetical protein